jgi:hypothetical protein
MVSSPMHGPSAVRRRPTRTTPGYADHQPTVKTCRRLVRSHIYLGALRSPVSCSAKHLNRRHLPAANRL